MNFFFLGAYAASPQAQNPKVWDPELEARYFKELGEIKALRGLELPFQGELHPHDSSWLLKHFNPKWKAVLTLLPGTMDRLKLDPLFGLASVDEKGRRAALEFTRAARLSVHALNEKFGAGTVVAVQLHSAPSQSRGSSSFHVFSQSLQEIQNWDWQGAQLWVEHCDQFIAGQEPVKGFLSLEQEIKAVNQLGAPFGISLNWGRSVVEARSADGAESHLLEAGKQGVLRALFFSGASQNHPLYGKWADSHAPFATPEMKVRDPENFDQLLLTGERIIRSLRENLKFAEGAGLSVLGIKIQPLPSSLSLEERLDWVRESVSFLSFCSAAAKRTSGK